MRYDDIYERLPFVHTTSNASTIIDGPRVQYPKSLLRLSKRKFHPFAKLPTEIRTQIWETALHYAAPRVVEVGFYLDGNGQSRCPSKTVVPSLLHVCCEARDLALNYYEPFTVDGIWTGTYIRWDLDYLYLNWYHRDWSNFHQSHSLLDLKFTKHCQHLLLNVTSHSRHHLQKILEMFPAVKDIAILCHLKAAHRGDHVFDEEDKYEGGAMQLFDLRQGYIGPVAVPVKRFREKQPVMVQSNGDIPPVTFLVAHQRAQPVSKRELRARRRMVDEWYAANPRPIERLEYPRYLPYNGLTSWSRMRLHEASNGWGIRGHSSRLILDERCSYCTTESERALCEHDAKSARAKREIYYNARWECKRT